MVSVELLRVVRQSERHPRPVELQEVDPVLRPGYTPAAVEIKRADAKLLLLEHLTDGLGLGGVEEGVVAVVQRKVEQGSIAGQLVAKLSLQRYKVSPQICIIYQVNS